LKTHFQTAASLTKQGSSHRRIVSVNQEHQHPTISLANQLTTWAPVEDWRQENNLLILKFYSNEEI
jgi:hypothetical protein